MSLTRYLPFILLLFTLVSFAANSILCRMALVAYKLGALEFTIIRLVSGAIMLLPVVLSYGRRSEAEKDRSGIALLSTYRDTMPSLALFGYALFFSLAYVKLDAGTGALILFAAVQITMIGIHIVRGSRLTIVEWLGFGLAFGGLIYLLLPGLSAPPLSGAALMLISGMSWGVYSLMGKGARRPVLSTARNFVLCLPGCALLLIVIMVRSGRGDHTFTSGGILLAVLSGAVTSALGYVLWYVTLKRITTTLASIAQLAVPVIAGFGGVIFLREIMSLRLILASGLIIGGIVVTIAGKRRTNVGGQVTVRTGLS